MNALRHLLVFTGFLFLHCVCRAQRTDTIPSRNDTIPAFIKGKTTIPARPPDTVTPNSRPIRQKTTPYKVDSLARRQHDPRKATIRSAIIPGWGQLYNRKYWKLPIVYAAVGIPAYAYFSNRAWYRKCQFALTILNNYQAAGFTGSQIPDTMLAKINVDLRPLVAAGEDNSIRTARNEYRKNEDYSVLFFMLFWGLNVVDATVDAHLMYFDVSDNLTMRFDAPSPGFLPPGGSTAGLSLVFDFHKPRFKPFPLR